MCFPVDRRFAGTFARQIAPRYIACLSSRVVRDEKKLENRIGLPHYAPFEVLAVYCRSSYFSLMPRRRRTPPRFTQPPVNYESNFHIRPAVARTHVKQRRARKIVPSFIARSAMLAQLACLLGAPVFPACRFFSFDLSRTSREREHFLPAERRRPLVLPPLFPIRPTGACYLRRHEIVSFNCPQADFDRELPFFLSLSFSPSGTAPVDLNEFFPFGTRRLLLPFSRSAGQPSLVSLEIFYPMNSCGSSGKSGRSIVSIVGHSLIRRKRSIVKFGSIIRNCLTQCLFSEFCTLQENFYKRTIIKYYVI